MSETGVTTDQTEAGTALTEINRQLVCDFNSMLVLNARLSRELEALDRAPGWAVSTADLLAAVPVRDLLAEIERRIPDAR